MARLLAFGLLADGRLLAAHCSTPGLLPSRHTAEWAASMRGSYCVKVPAGLLALTEITPMRYLAVVCDYDGTIAKNGIVDPETIASLERTKASGRRLILATGRELEDLARIFPAVGLFDRVVGENGAIIYDPSAGTTKRLAEPPPPRFIQMLRDHGVTPLSVGQVIVATRQPNETVVLQLIRELGLELQVIFNKGAVMVLPSSIDKGLGVIAALEELDLSPHQCVGVGDAENDDAFLDVCECSAAVANALPAIKERVDLVTQRTYGAGVRELLDLIAAQDSAV